MSRYSEALEMFCNATAVFKEENGMLVMVAHNDNLRKETSILEEAISKAEKYDELDKLEIENKLIYKDHCDTIKRLEQENKELKNEIATIRNALQKKKGKLRHYSICKKENQALKEIQKEDKYWLGVLHKENKEIKDGVKALLNHINCIDINAKFVLMRFETNYVDIDDGEDYNKIQVLLEVIRNVR